jgi:2-oxo-4-hydroxy-4-carboxy--5-ureidoimidazoline (OHCU) decarboxylase
MVSLSFSYHCRRTVDSYALVNHGNSQQIARYTCAQQVDLTQAEFCRSMASLPDIATIPSLDVEQRAGILDTLFEPCTQLHTLSVSLLHEQKFTSYTNLIDALGKQLYDLQQSDLVSDQKWLDAILSAHPRLGEKKVDSEQSRKEQAQLNAGGEGEAEKLAELNRKYEEKFPDLRYVYAIAM